MNRFLPLLLAALVVIAVVLFVSAKRKDDRATVLASSKTFAPQEEISHTIDAKDDLEEPRTPLFAEPAEAVPDDVDPPPFEAPADRGWNVWGVVRSLDGKPVAGARVLLWYVGVEQAWTKRAGQPLHCPAMVEASTGSIGVYQAFVPLPERFAKLADLACFPGEIGGTAAAPRQGFAGEPDSCRPFRLPSPAGKERVVRIDFVLVPGALLAGRVLTAEGAPVYGADVTAHRADLSSSRQEQDLPIHSEATTDPEGVYVIAFREEFLCGLSARKNGVGAGSVDPIPLVPSADLEAPDLVLGDAGRISGLAIYPDGSPIGELPIMARAERIFDPGAPGLERSTVLTDREGSFEFRGLKPGTYDLMTDRTRGLWELHDTGERDVCIVVDAHRIEIVLRDEKGLLLPRVFVSCLGGWSERNRLVPFGRTMEWIDTNPVLVAAAAADRMPARQWVFFGEAQREATVELVLPKALPPGQLDLAVVGPDGKPAPYINAHFTMMSDGEEWFGHVDCNYFSRSENGRFMIPLLPGKYSFWISMRYYSSALITGVEVRSGETTSAEVGAQIEWNLNR